MIPPKWMILHRRSQIQASENVLRLLAKGVTNESKQLYGLFQDQRVMKIWELQSQMFCPRQRPPLRLLLPGWQGVRCGAKEKARLFISCLLVYTLIYTIFCSGRREYQASWMISTPQPSQVSPLVQSMPMPAFTLPPHNSFVVPAVGSTHSTAYETKTVDSLTSLEYSRPHIIVEQPNSAVTTPSEMARQRRQSTIKDSVASNSIDFPETAFCVPRALIARRPEALASLRTNGTFSLPEESVCKDLVRSYFHHFHCTFPIVDANLFLKAYILGGPGKINLLLLWSMFSVAANVSRKRATAKRLLIGQSSSQMTPFMFPAMDLDKTSDGRRINEQK